LLATLVYPQKYGEKLVLETILEELFGISRKGVSDIDLSTRFYVLWRYTYGKMEVDGGEALFWHTLKMLNLIELWDYLQAKILFLRKRKINTD